jgi:hypothetical protein
MPSIPFIKSYDIAAFAFQAGLYCPGCIQVVLPEDPRYDGWAVAQPTMMTAEDNLNEVATAFGINRQDESTFDSDDFPKVVFAGQLEGDEYCGRCGGEL